MIGAGRMVKRGLAALVLSGGLATGAILGTTAAASASTIGVNLGLGHNGLGLTANVGTLLCAAVESGPRGTFVVVLLPCPPPMNNSNG